MRLTTVFVMGITLVLMLFAACQKTETIHCKEGIEGTYEATTVDNAVSAVHLEITEGTAEQEKIVVIKSINPKDGSTNSAAVTGHWEEQSQTLIIPAQDYGSISIQITGKLHLQQNKVVGTLQTTQEEGAILHIKIKNKKV